MNTANYQSDGNVMRQKYPLSVESLEFIQQQIMLVHAIGNIAGANCIVEGCNVAGTQTTKGVVIINNEVLPFVAGVTQPKVRIREVTDSITAQFVNYANARVRRWVEFGENAGGADTFLWEEFARLKTNKQLDDEKATHDDVATMQGYIMPTGGIIMWSGSIQNIPDGWALCDGENGTPNLQNKFVVGAGQQYSVDSTGGSVSKSLEANNIPAHKHQFQWSSFSSSADNVESTRIVRGHNNVENAIKETEPFGQGQPFDIMPPYYALAYIMKL